VEFFRRASPQPRSVALLAGSFNPPTVAHLELARAAGRRADEILCVVPRVFPHKIYFGATIEQRLEMLNVMGLPEPYSVAASEQGLFVDIAAECRPAYGPETRMYFVCGRDAAERILGWDYGEAGVVEQMLLEFELLVAARGGSFQPPGEFRNRIHELAIPVEHDPVSSSEVRERIARGEVWEHLVPAAIVERVREIYGR
jgi:nicotinate-nucleotide adenylyltransferase